MHVIIFNFNKEYELRQFYCSLIFSEIFVVAVNTSSVNFEKIYVCYVFLGKENIVQNSVSILFFILQ